MDTSGRKGGRSGIKAGVLLGGCVTLLALPSAVLAFTANFESPQTDDVSARIDPVEPDPARFARALAIRSLAKGQQFPFTPVGAPNRPDRSVTVAVRVDPTTVKAITVRGSEPVSDSDKDLGQLRIAPTAFNLGVSRGYRNFAQNLVQQPQSSRAVGELPDLKKFSLSPGAKPSEPRFSPRISIDEKQVSGRAPRTFSGDAGEVDVGGAYRVTDHLDVTAGVRYSQERERIAPVTDGKLDSQAVYVGTQYKF